MSNFDRDPVSVASRQVHGPSFGVGTLALVGVLGLGAGTILGGVIMPFLRSTPPDQSQSQKLEAAQATSRALLFSMYPQTIYASLRDGGELVSTALSVEEYLAALEVRSSQAGLTATKSIERKGDSVEISYAFSEENGASNRTFPQAKTKTDHPKSLVLIFGSGPLPATLALQKARIEGRERSAGAVFVDLVSLGAMPPTLGEGQYLTSRGVFEIKLTGTGVGAFLDGVLVYPAAPPKLGPALAFPGTKPPEPPVSAALPNRLALQSFQPAVGILKDRLILVASETANDACAAKAIILDTKRGTVLELPEPLTTPSVSVTNAKDALVFNGFCVTQSPAPSPSSSPLPMPSLPTLPDAAKVEVRLSARYDLKTGALTWQRQSVVIPPPAPIAAVDSGAQSGAATPWRAVSETRLASPVLSGGAMMSVACRPGGGVTLALSGLPAPADGQAAGIRFARAGGASVAQMRWRASAGGYELDGTGRPNEARAILDQLRAGGQLSVSGAGASKALAAPGRAQIDRLVARCGAATVRAPAPVVPTNGGVAKAPTPKPKPKPPIPTVAPAPKNKPAAQTVVPPPAQRAPVPKPKPKVAPAPIPVPKKQPAQTTTP
jgi:hypothetical protein